MEVPENWSTLSIDDKLAAVFRQVASANSNVGNLTVTTNNLNEKVDKLLVDISGHSKRLQDLEEENAILRTELTGLKNRQAREYH
ncbi:hypothetical protein TSAR_001705 [Trichomalopsis sarcophagae]|uniref:Uncharacterized protein n=1 Tax=Trichomalopsis sarcophagae TaxID=543379 RepID=A0A232EGK9_9HYME|nr:hypothetical protein TSAR_001705 [Trichomalopsis sarcophagae]